jgi:hypothetical protein
MEIGPGAQLDNISLTVMPQKLYRVRGRIDFGGQTPPDPGFSLYVLAPFQMPGTSRRQQLRSGSVSANGLIELNDLPPGTYSLGVLSNRRASMPTSPNSNAAEEAYFTFDVKEDDIEDMEFRASLGTAIRGRVRVADGSPLNTIRTSFGRLQVGLDSNDPLQPAGFSLVDPNDGSFNLKGIVGRYRIGLPIVGGAYISEVRLSGERNAEPVVSIPNGFAGDLEIILSTNGGSIAGRLVDVQSRPITGTTFGLLLPATAQNASGFLRQFSTRDDGTFSLESIPPGNYRIYVWEGIDQTSIFDPALLEQSRAQATVVRVTERSEVSASVVAIRAR